MDIQAGRKRHSAEDIVRKLRRADELSAAGNTAEKVAAELEVSAATSYNWRRFYGGMDTDATKELKELREQNGRFKRRAYARDNPGRGFRRAWAHLRHDRAMVVNKKKIHRLRAEEGL